MKRYNTNPYIRGAMLESEGGGDYVRYTDAQAEIERLEGRVAELEAESAKVELEYRDGKAADVQTIKDAARYRWLVENFSDYLDSFIKVGVSTKVSAAWDDTIDAAIAGGREDLKK